MKGQGNWVPLAEKTLFTFVAALLMAVALPTAVLAVPQPPHRFHGTVLVDGAPAPDGLTVTAEIPGASFPYSPVATTSEGRFGDSSPLFKVPADDLDTEVKEGGVDGDTVYFYVNGVRAGSYTYSIGGSTELVLSLATAPAAPPSTLPAPANVRRTTPDADSSPTFAWEVVIGAASYEISLDGVAFTDVGNVTSHTLPDLADGVHTFIVRPVSVTGQPGTGSEQYVFIIDTTAPEVDLRLAADVSGGSATLVGTAADATTAVVLVEYRVDDGDWAAASALDGAFDGASEDFTFTVSGLSGGQHTVEVRAADAAGNVVAPPDYAKTSFTVEAGASAEGDGEEAEPPPQEPADEGGAKSAAPALMPASFVASDLVIAPAEASAGEAVIISLVIANAGDMTGSYEVVLSVDDVVVGRRRVMLAGGASQEVTFSVSSDVAGSHAVAVAGLTGSFRVAGLAAGLAARGWLVALAIVAALLLGTLAWLAVLRRRMD